jgi:beta-N-acetylhexosaminidase
VKLLLPALAILSQTPVKPGIDVLRAEGPELVAGRRVGLITHAAGKTIDGVPTLRVLREELGLEVVALFAPEHGFDSTASAGERIETESEGETGLPIHSLYGETRAPTSEMLSSVDVLVLDLQDVGVRFFTYASTMKLAMESAARAGIGFVVLDRPNPLGGDRVEGPVLEAEYESFVGAAAIPLIHGMTLGELARLFRAEDPHLAKLELRVVEMRGFTRSMQWEDTGLPFRPPSPNLRTPKSVLAYPAFGLLEGVEVSEGRGTEEAFEKMGAPWIVEADLSGALTARELPGVVFPPTSFTPRSMPAALRPRLEGEPCRGVFLRVVDPRAYAAVRTGLEVIATLRSLYARNFRWVKSGEHYWIDTLLGTDRPRRALEEGVGVERILDRERAAVEEFLQRRKPHLLY